MQIISVASSGGRQKCKFDLLVNIISAWFFEYIPGLDNDILQSGRQHHNIIPTEF